MQRLGRVAGAGSTRQVILHFGFKNQPGVPEVLNLPTNRVVELGTKVEI